MKKAKRILSFLLAASVAVSSLTFPAFAEETAAGDDTVIENVTEGEESSESTGEEAATWESGIVYDAETDSYTWNVYENAIYYDIYLGDIFILSKYDVFDTAISAEWVNTIFALENLKGNTLSNADLKIYVNCEEGFILPSDSITVNYEFAVNENLPAPKNFSVGYYDNIQNDDTTDCHYWWDYVDGAINYIFKEGTEYSICFPYWGHISTDSFESDIAVYAVDSNGHVSVPATEYTVYNDIFFRNDGCLMWSVVDGAESYAVKVRGYEDLGEDTCFDNSSSNYTTLFSTIPGGTYTLDVYSVDSEGAETLAWSIDYDYVNEVKTWESGITYDEATDTITWSIDEESFDKYLNGEFVYTELIANGRVFELFSGCPSDADTNLFSVTDIEISLLHEALEAEMENVDFSGEIEIKPFVYYNGYSVDSKSILSKCDALATDSVIINYGYEISEKISNPVDLEYFKSGVIKYTPVEGAVAVFVRDGGDLWYEYFGNDIVVDDGEFNIGNADISSLEICFVDEDYNVTEFVTVTNINEADIYFDDYGDLYWTRIDDIYRYNVRIEGQPDYICDECYSNFSYAYKYLFTENVLPSGTYTLNVYSVDENENETLAWSIDYDYVSKCTAQAWDADLSYDEATDTLTWTNYGFTHEPVESGWGWYATYLITANGEIVDYAICSTWDGQMSTETIRLKAELARQFAVYGTEFSGDLDIRIYAYKGMNFDYENSFIGLTTVDAIGSEFITVSYDGCEELDTIAVPEGIYGVKALEAEAGWNAVEGASAYIVKIITDGEVDYSVVNTNSHTEYMDYIPYEMSIAVAVVDADGNVGAFSEDIVYTELYEFTYDGSPLNFTVKEYAESESGLGCDSLGFYQLPDVTYGETTFAELKQLYSGFKINNLAVNNCSPDTLSPEDFTVRLLLMYGKDGSDYSGWITTTADKLCFGNYDFDDSYVIQNVGFQIDLDDEVIIREGITLDSVVTANSWTPGLVYDENNGTLTFNRCHEASGYKIYVNGENFWSVAWNNPTTSTHKTDLRKEIASENREREKNGFTNLIEGEVVIGIEPTDSEFNAIEGISSSETITITIPEYEKNTEISPTTLKYTPKTGLLSWDTVIGAKYYVVEVYNSDSETVAWGEGVITGIYLDENINPLTVGESYTAKLWLIDTQFRYSEKYLELEFVYREPTDGYMEWDANLTYDAETDRLTWNRLEVWDAVTAPDTWLSLENYALYVNGEQIDSKLTGMWNNTSSGSTSYINLKAALAMQSFKGNNFSGDLNVELYVFDGNTWIFDVDNAYATASVTVSGYDGCQMMDTFSAPQNVLITPYYPYSDNHAYKIDFDDVEGANGYILVAIYGNEIQVATSHSHSETSSFDYTLFVDWDIDYIQFAVCAVDKNGDVSELTPYYYANTGFKDIDHTIPAGYTEKYSFSGTHTYIGTEDDPGNITNGAIVDVETINIGCGYQLNENDIIIAATSLKNRQNDWQSIVFNGYASDFTGWNAVNTAFDGKLALRATVADIMAANDITDIGDLGGFELQTWGVADGDEVDYVITVYSPVHVSDSDAFVWAADSDAAGYKVVIEGTDLSFDVSDCALENLNAIFAENNIASGSYTLKAYAVYSDGTESLIGAEIYGYSDGTETDENGYIVHKNTAGAVTYTAKYDEYSNYKFVLNANVEIPLPAIANNVCTIGELKNVYSGVSIEGFEITGTDREGITAEDFVIEIYVFYGSRPDDWSGWNQYETTSLDFSDVDIPDNYFLHHVGYKISLKDEVLEESGMVEGDTITVSFKTGENIVYIDEEGVLRWSAVDGAESYYVRIQGQSADIHDWCGSNNSENYINLFNTANLASGTYVLEIYAASGETETLVGTIEYEHTRYAVTVGSNTFYYKANDDGYTITSGNIVDGDVVIPAEIDGTPVTEIGETAFSAFHNTTTDNIKTVVIPEGVKRIAYYAFNSCDNLISVTLPDSLESIAQFAFERCHKLTTVTIPKGVSSILGGSFTHNEGMLSIECDADNEYYCSVNGVLFTKDKKTLVAYPTGKAGAYTVPATVTIIGDAAFYGATGLTSVEILGTLNSIGFEAFAECDKITSVTINEGVTYVGYWAFRGCTAINTTYVPDSVTNIGDKAFGFDGWGDDMFVYTGFSLSGKSGSMIEAYANRHGIPFKEIGETENSPFDEESKQEASVDSFEGEKIELAPSKNMKDKEELDKDFNFDDFEFVVEEIEDNRKDVYKEHFDDDKVKGKAYFFEFDLKDKDGNSHGDKFDGLVEMDIPMCDDLKYGYDNYHLYRMVDGEKLEIPGKHIVKNDKHYYRVHLEHFSDYVFVNETVEEVQTAPFNVRTAVGEGTKVTLSWDKPEGATGYAVYRTMVKGGELTKLCTTNYESYVDTGVVQGKTYYYYIVAENADKALTSDYSEFAFATIPEDNISSFVERLYGTMLGRESDANGKAKWIQKFKAGSTAADVAINFVLSKEITLQNLSNEEFVTRMYETMLNRTPADSEIANWASYLEAGCTYAYVFRGFLTAPEFAKLCSSYGIETGTNEPEENRDVNGKLTKFISRLYTKALNRTYDVSGLNHHTGNYISGKYTLDVIASGFIFSTEFEKRKLSDESFVECMYNTFFDRASDAGGKAKWLEKMANGMTREQVFNGFVISAEYKALVKSFGL